MNDPKKIEEIQGFKTGTNEQGIKESKELLNSAIILAASLVAKQLPLQTMVSLAISASMQTVNALLSTSKVQCDIVNPPADIETRLDSSGRMIYRCFHQPAHEWDLSGNKLP
jgi:hypothetical protein